MKIRCVLLTVSAVALLVDGFQMRNGHHVLECVIVSKLRHSALLRRVNGKTLVLVLDGVCERFGGLGDVGIVVGHGIECERVVDVELLG